MLAAATDAWADCYTKLPLSRAPLTDQVGRGVSETRHQAPKILSSGFAAPPSNKAQATECGSEER